MDDHSGVGRERDRWVIQHEQVSRHPQVDQQGVLRQRLHNQFAPSADLFHPLTRKSHTK
jgi:hypothetical protein